MIQVVWKERTIPNSYRLENYCCIDCEIKCTSSCHANINYIWHLVGNDKVDACSYFEKHFSNICQSFFTQMSDSQVEMQKLKLIPFKSGLHCIAFLAQTTPGNWIRDLHLSSFHREVEITNFTSRMKLFIFLIELWLINCTAKTFVLQFASLTVGKWIAQKWWEHLSQYKAWRVYAVKWFGMF